MAEKKLSLKLLVDSKANKVLFAEAGKEFVDLLFHILSLPVATVVKLLNVNGMVGSVGSLYKSVESLSSDNFQANFDKDVPLKPQAAFNALLLQPNNGPAASSHTVYECAHCYIYRSYNPKTLCPACLCSINMPSTHFLSQSAVNIRTTSNNSRGGYVKGVVKYMVMDDLEVKPMSTISLITSTNKFNVKDVSAVVEKEVQVGFTEGLAMLKASFEVTNSVLTSVFLIKKEA